jgi:hypothetical protein
MRAYEEVVRPDAKAVVAVMADLRAMRYRPIDQFP